MAAGGTGRLTLGASDSLCGAGCGGRCAAGPVCADAAFPPVYRSGPSAARGILRLSLCSPFPNTSNGMRGQSKIRGCGLGLAALYLEGDIKN